MRRRAPHAEPAPGWPLEPRLSPRSRTVHSHPGLLPHALGLTSALGLSPTARTPRAVPPRPGCPLAPEGGSPSRLSEEPLQLPSLFQVPPSTSPSLQAQEVSSRRQGSQLPSTARSKVQRNLWTDVRMSGSSQHRQESWRDGRRRDRALTARPLLCREPCFPAVPRSGDQRVKPFDPGLPCGRGTWYGQRGKPEVGQGGLPPE